MLKKIRSAVDVLLEFRRPVPSRSDDDDAANCPADHVLFESLVDFDPGSVVLSVLMMLKLRPPSGPAVHVYPGFDTM